MTDDPDDPFAEREPDQYDIEDGEYWSQWYAANPDWGLKPTEGDNAVTDTRPG